MNRLTKPSNCPRRNWILAALLMAVGVLFQNPASALTLQVVDGHGATITVPFRWQVELDNTAHHVPGVLGTDAASLVANNSTLQINRSHAPLVTNGNSAGGSATILVPATEYYYISVLAEGYQIGGINVAAGQTTARVILNKHKVPTAQLSILAFEDRNTINAAPDDGEPGLAGFGITLFDNGGYFTAGVVSQDAFSHPIGTTYKLNPDGTMVEDAEGNPVVDVIGTGNLVTDANGECLIKYLAPNKYGIQIVPRDKNGGDGGWIQTSTIEGTPGIDAWVKSAEPTQFIEMGLAGQHVFIGFIKPSTLPWGAGPGGPGGHTLTGRLVNNHYAKPPLAGGPYTGEPVSEGWIGLNQGVAGPGLYATACNPDTGEFTISGVPDGTYELVMWDKPLDYVFGFTTVVVNGADVAIGDVTGVNGPYGTVTNNAWFGTQAGHVFYDANSNGFMDPGEAGITKQTLNLRFRDATIYQSTLTRDDGSYEFKEVFPFFKWLIAEVDFTRYKATGMTAAVDNGGPIPAGFNPLMPWAMPTFGKLTPQPQFEADGVTPIINPNTGNNLSRTEVGDPITAPVLLEAFQNYAGMSNVIDWGKKEYAPGENGGITGIAYYTTTRAEDDPKYAAGEPWEPGIPRVEFALYQDKNGDGVIDDINGVPGIQLADVDNYPLGWRDGGVKGPEDVDHNGNGTFDQGDAYRVSWSDSFDDSAPADVMHFPKIEYPVGSGNFIDIPGGFDSWGTWNQVRPGVFDGGYGFFGIPAGLYIVQTCPPPGYLIQTEEAKNVTLGDSYTAGTSGWSGSIPLNNPVSEPQGANTNGTLLPSATFAIQTPDLVGTQTNHGGASGDSYVARFVPASRMQGVNANPYVVAPHLSLFPGSTTTPGEDAPHAGELRPLADMKWVRVADGRNAAADFHLYTEVPKAAHAEGIILNDLGAVFNVNLPGYGEKDNPLWIPISFRDWADHEVNRVYSDAFGSYEALLPSTYSVHIPMPSGVSPNILTVILNDPLMPDPAHPGERIPDPFFDADYCTPSYQLQYYPGTTTYPDTPLLPVGSFVGGPNKKMDVEAPSGTPAIFSAEGPLGGPLLLTAGPAGAVLTIRSLGATQVPNPLATPFNRATQPLLVTRDYGFGATRGEGTVTIAGYPLTVLTWNDAEITARAPAGVPTGQLLVNRDPAPATAGSTLIASRIGVTVTVGAPLRYVVVSAAPYPATPIQTAVDAASPGTLVLVKPGEYRENPIMWKPVQLQGSGMGTIINARPLPIERVDAWHAKAAVIYNTPGADPFAANFMAGITIAGDAGSIFQPQFSPRVDGFRILGSQNGSGIYAHIGARFLTISNNRVQSNLGDFAGGIAIGVAGTEVGTSGNDHVTIKNNEILRNSMINLNSTGGGGGIGIFSGSDDYVITGNIIQGNFSTANGGGIAHWGLSRRGLIENNKILFNEVVNDTLGYGTGGGVYIAGEAGAAGLSAGAGSVTVNGNLIQGNLSGAGDGGGVRVELFNGTDVSASPANQNNWHTLNLTNNVIVNNVAGWLGGGVSLDDVARSFILQNTIANNDSTSTAAITANIGTPASAGAAGLVTHHYSAGLSAVVPGAADFVNPVIRDNIIWHNRSFYLNTTTNALVPDPLGAPGAFVYRDLQVYPTSAGTLSPQYCVLTTPADFPAGNNRVASPATLFAAEYFNSLLHTSIPDEARFSIWVRYPEINPQGNYHVANGYALTPSLAGETSYPAAVPATVQSLLGGDWDRDHRPNGPAREIGADEVVSVVPTVIAQNDNYTFPGNVLLNVVAPANGVLANDTGPAPAWNALLGANRRVELVRGPQHAAVFAISNLPLLAGGFSYAPTPNFYGVDSFTYRAYLNGTTNFSYEATATITVTPFNRAPVASSDSYTVVAGTSVTVAAPGVLTNDTDPTGDPLTAVLIPASVPAGATVLLNPNGSFTYTPDPANLTPRNDTFRYRANDGALSSNPAAGTVVTIAVTAPRPNFTITGVVLEPDPAYAGMPMKAVVTVKNVGSVAGNAGTLAIWANRPGVNVPVGTAGDMSVSAGSIAAGASANYQFDGLTAPSVPSPVTFRAYINSTGSTLETSILDNQFTLSYTVLTGTSFQSLPTDTDGIDTDGDGNPNNDVVYAHLSASDGYAMMADGYELYTFGFNDQTLNALTLAPTFPQMVIPFVMMDGALRANISGPTLVLKEGQQFYLDLSTVGMWNRPDLFDPHTIHFHGFPNAAPIFDGEPMASLAINAGASNRFYYNLVEPGTYFYHCHVEATEHMEMGMLANLWVLPKQNNLAPGTPLAHLPAGKGAAHQAGYKYVYNDGDGSTNYDVEFPVQIGGYDRAFHDADRDIQNLPFETLHEDYPVINGRGYPDTVNPNPINNISTQERLGLDAPFAAQKTSTLITATQGQRILLRVSNVALTDPHTLTVLGIPVRVVGKDARLLRGPTGLDLSYETTSITSGGGETADLILDTTNVSPGTYFLYDSRLNHLCNLDEDFGGMMTEIRILPQP